MESTLPHNCIFILQYKNEKYLLFFLHFVIFYIVFIKSVLFEKFSTPFACTSCDFYLQACDFFRKCCFLIFAIFARANIFFRKNRLFLQNHKQNLHISGNKFGHLSSWSGKKSNLEILIFYKRIRKKLLFFMFYVDKHHIKVL